VAGNRQGHHIRPFAAKAISSLSLFHFVGHPCQGSGLFVACRKSFLAPAAKGLFCWPPVHRRLNAALEWQAGVDPAISVASTARSGQSDRCPQEAFNSARFGPNSTEKLEVIGPPFARWSVVFRAAPTVPTEYQRSPGRVLEVRPLIVAGGLWHLGSFPAAGIEAPGSAAASGCRQQGGRLGVDRPSAAGASYYRYPCARQALLALQLGCGFDP